MTRFAQAQREVALAIGGEAPATKGYPPSVFARLPQLVERAGNGVAGEGSITAFYTVLAEGDQISNDPIVDAARAVLDGHIVLARRIADGGRYPAIDVEASVQPRHARHHARDATRSGAPLSADHEHNTGAQPRSDHYRGLPSRGSDPRIDGAIARWPQIEAYLRQDMRESVSLAHSTAQLAATMAETAEASRPK